MLLKYHWGRGGGYPKKINFAHKGEEGGGVWKEAKFAHTILEQSQGCYQAQLKLQVQLQLS